MPRNLANGRRPATGWAGVFLFLLLMGCATQRGPVLYPNEHLKAAEEDQARQDIAECNRLAENYVKSQPGSEAAKGGLPEGPWRERSWATRGAVTGHFGRGAAIGGVAGGTSGLIHGSTKNAQPSPVYKNFAERCLREKGYEPIGWK